MRKQQPLPTAEELEKLPAVVKIHISGIQHMIANDKGEADAEVTEAWLKSAIEDGCKTEGQEVEVVGACVPMGKDGFSMGWGFVRVRKEHVVALLRTLDGVYSRIMERNLFLSLMKSQDKVIA